MFLKRIAVFLLGLACAWANLASAQDWPDRPVKLVVPFPAGGAADIPARLLAEQLARIWGQSVVVENRPGAAGALGASEVARSAADGYTLFFPSGSVMTANQHIYSKLAYDPDKDFVPVSTVAAGPQVLVVPAKSPYRSAQDLIAAARKSPGKLTFGHAGVGSQSQLAAESFVSAAGIDAVAVAYKGDPPALVDLAGGVVDFCVANLAAAISHIRSGRVRALGVTSAASIVQLPGVPALADTLPDFQSRGWFGVVAPAGTPAAVVRKVNDSVREALADAGLKEKLAGLGMEAVGDTPEAMGSMMAQESARIARIVTERHLAVR